MKKELTKEEAIILFRQLWTDMQTELGDAPDERDRLVFKKEWCRKRFPDEEVRANCPLCEYAHQVRIELMATRVKAASFFDCRYCPLAWPIDSEDLYPDCCLNYGDLTNYMTSPISEILALPEREVPDDTNETI